MEEELVWLFFVFPFTFNFKHKKHAVLAYSWFKVSFYNFLRISFLWKDICGFFSYIQYSAVCARTLRRCLKSSAAKDAMKREESFVRVSKWQSGKVSELVHPPSELIFPFVLCLIYFLFLETEQKS
jgi:hypothetical protein